jgi:N-methylhydantoinase A
MGTPRVGIDAGGTFTDGVAELPDGDLTVRKFPSTPDDPARAVVDCERALAAGGPVAALIHGSTVATNAFLEGRLGSVGLVVNRGFEDVLAIGRQRRRGLYSFVPAGPRRIVPDAMIRGVAARASAGGATVAPLDVAELDRAADELRRAGARTIVVAFLHSARHPGLEREALARLRARGIPAVGSHEVTSEPREYERWATAVVDAGLAPVMAAYIAGLAGRVAASDLRIMLSSGGCARAAEAAGRAVSTILSGPAAGVIGARLVARAAGIEGLVTFDMGGTSCDVAVVPGEPMRTTETEIDGVPLRVPLIDIQTVGAGGGSIAWVDRGGALRVGPRSAGAAPGPACYGAGGEDATLTDAHVVLGHLDPERFLGGARPLAPELAWRAIERIGRRLGAPARETAAAIVAVARGHLERAIRRVTLERGRDPADLTIVAFGGAGGLHAAAMASRLGCPRVLVPKAAGVLSALGCLAAEVRRDVGEAVLSRADAAGATGLAETLARLASEAHAALDEEGVPSDRRVLERSLAMRYVGQSYEIDVPADDAVPNAAGGSGAAGPAAAFHRLHAERYGHARWDAPVEIVTARVGAIGTGNPPALPLHRPEATDPTPPRTVRIGADGVPAEARAWESLPPGHRGRGPALVLGDHATALVPADWRWRVDGFGNLVLESDRARGADRAR